MEYTEMLEKQVGQLRKANETDYAAYMHALSAANQFRDERDALKAQVEQLREALRDLVIADLVSHPPYSPLRNNAEKALATTEPKAKP